MKKCSKCFEVKSLNSFNCCSKAKDGLRSECKICQKKYNQIWRENANKIELSVRAKQWREQNKERLALYEKGRGVEKQRLWRLKNPNYVKTYNDNYYAINRTYISARKKAHPEKGLAQNARRRAAKLRATPIWANQFFIEEIYNLARLRTKSTGVKYHVDHIVPLKSRIVCGLHVEHNLQLVPASLNLSKGNRFWPDMPSNTLGEPE